MTDFVATRKHFHLPEGVTYLDGNSLGPLPRAAVERVRNLLRTQWGELLIRGWNDAGWMDMPVRLGDRLGALLGAPPGSVVVGDTLSIKVHQALDAALQLRPERRVVLSDTGNFSSDLYIARALLRTLGVGHELRLVAPAEVAEHIDEQVAALLLTEVDYRTGRRHDMAALTARAHAAGALAIWDLAHSAGALPVDVTATQADFAVGCTYKYLNGGPGAPAFIYVAPRHVDAVQPGLPGWLGHETPFGFELDYRPAPGSARMRIGTPPVVALAALEAAIDVWDDVDIADVWARAVALSERFIAAVERDCPQLALASPRRPCERGSQVSFRHPRAEAVIGALARRGVIADFRAPDILRFGITPLYLDEADMDRAAAALAEVLAEDGIARR